MTEAARSYRMTVRADAVEQTRERVLRAARERFVALPYDEVTLTAVARDAGVTQQTLLNHFTSKEGLLLALVDGFTAEVAELRGPVPPGNARAAMRGLLRQYEAFGDANVRMDQLADRIPAVGRLVETGRRNHRAWLEEVFASRLPAGGAARRRTLAQAYVATSVGTWRLLRRELGHSRTETAHVMTALLEAALAPSATTGSSTSSTTS